MHQRIVNDFVYNLNEQFSKVTRGNVLKKAAVETLNDVCFLC